MDVTGQGLAQILTQPLFQQRDFADKLTLSVTRFQWRRSP
jgi:hypothetical protein